MNYFLVKKAIKNSWGKDTAYRDDVDKWSPINSSAGQCAVTALILHNYFGGKIYSGVSDDDIVHFWNIIYGVKIDLTREQFKNTKKFKDVMRWDANELLKTGNVNYRYEILKKRVENYLLRK